MTRFVFSSSMLQHNQDFSRYIHDGVPVSYKDEHRQRLKRMEGWTEKEQTQAEVKIFILNRLFKTLSQPPYSPDKAKAVAKRLMFMFSKRVQLVMFSL